MLNALSTLNNRSFFVNFRLAFAIRTSKFKKFTFSFAHCVHAIYIILKVIAIIAQVIKLYYKLSINAKIK